MTLNSPEETTALARQIAAILAPGDVVLLEGDIGAGKTHFARSLIQSLLQVPEDVPSPTFTLVQTYETPIGEIWHADLYRLTSPDEIVELGLVDAFDQAICLIEWPDRLADLAPASALHLSFELGAGTGQRRLAMTGTPLWADRLAGLA
nr:tRNA (adenosine(37)-N6)-threonylcarbamoyltransferase complex ATPase subunit type 1 TsaE [Thiosulfatihalobacter marinus]